MTPRHRIFERVQIRPAQLRTVAERRFADAEALSKTRRNERANGVMYLAGFVIECLLKAKLLEFRWLETAGSSHGRPDDQQQLWSLCYRSHDLGEILARLPEVMDHLAVVEESGQSRLLNNLRYICAQWTVRARYSPFSAMMSEAIEFLWLVEELKEWLK